MSDSFLFKNIKVFFLVVEVHETTLHLHLFTSLYVLYIQPLLKYAILLVPQGKVINVASNVLQSSKSSLRNLLNPDSLSPTPLLGSNFRPAL